MTDDREWTDAERRALRDIGEASPPPPGLEDGVVGAAAERGLVRRDHEGARSLGSWWNAVIAAAAAIALLVGGAWIGARLAGPAVPEGSRYLLLLYEGPGFDASGEVAAEYATWVARMRDLGRAVEGEELAPEAQIEGPELEGAAADTTVGRRNGAARRTGRPTGYFVVEARDLAEAQAIAHTHPHVGRGGTIEVRPIVER